MVYVNPNPAFAITRTVETIGGSKHLIKGIYYDGNALGHCYTGKAVSIAKSVIELTKEVVPGTAYIEGYAFGKMAGGSARFTQMAENVGVIRAFLKLQGFELEFVPPTTVKRQAGKGNWDKCQMADAFNKKFGYYPHELIGCEKHDSPASDIVDAYYLWEFGQK